MTKKNATNCTETKKCEGRRLFMVDIENYCGKALVTEEDVSRAHESIDRQFGLCDDDLVVIGTSHTNNMLNAGFAWRGPRHVMEHGRNGGDRALAKAIKDYRMERFSEVLILCGDGFFTETVRKIMSIVPVTVVSCKERLNRRLMQVAPNVLAA